MVERRTPRKWTAAQKREIVAYLTEHGPVATTKKYGVSDSLPYVWRNQAAGKPPYPSQRPKGNGHARGKHLEGLILLRKAVATIEAELAAGAKLRTSDAYVRLALEELTTGKPA